MCFSVLRGDWRGPTMLPLSSQVGVDANSCSHYAYRASVGVAGATFGTMQKFKVVCISAKVAASMPSPFPPCTITIVLCWIMKAKVQIEVLSPRNMVYSLPRVHLSDV
ncbi:hypothetical protein PMIN07_003595 [Paraphaeosphaeria minitans]